MNIRCKKCNEDLTFHVTTNCAFGFVEHKGIYLFSDEQKGRNAEEITRDKQAVGYLQHAKIPSQSRFFENFLTRMPSELHSKQVLDLGCGPGPTVKLLTRNGFNKITAIDFSENSLRINQEENSTSSNINWIRADLQTLIFEPNSVDVLIMADFIQHVGTHQDKLNLLTNAVAALKPGGYFYFSFFNFNLYNYLKADLFGSFANGTIPYERLLPKEFIIFLSTDIKIINSYPMNITHKYAVDKFLGIFPLIKFISPMFCY